MGHPVFSGGFFYGWHALVWLVAVYSSLHGIIVAAVLKYADNIKKSFGHSLALGGTAILSIVIGDTSATVELFIGLMLVIVAIFLYATTGHKEEKEEELSNKSG